MNIEKEIIRIADEIEKVSIECGRRAHCEADAETKEGMQALSDALFSVQSVFRYNYRWDAKNFFDED